MSTKDRSAKHIRLTSHPVEGGHGALPIRWGRADPARARTDRGQHDHAQPAQCDRHAQRLATASIAHWPSQRARCCADHRPDLTDTMPADPLGPYPQWADAEHDRVDGSVRRGRGGRFQGRDRRGLRHPPDDRGDEGAHRHARGQAGDRRRAPARRRPHPARKWFGGGDQGGDRAGLVAARRGGTLWRRRRRPASRAVRGDGRHVSGARHARRPRGLPAADRGPDGVRVRQPARSGQSRRSR